MQQNAGQHQPGKQQSKVQDKKNQSRSATHTVPKGDGNDVASTEGDVDVHQGVDRTAELLVGVLAGDDTGQDACDDRTYQADEAEGGKKELKDLEKQSDGIKNHDGDDEAERGGDFAIIGRSHGDGRGRGGDRLLGRSLAFFCHDCCLGVGGYQYRLS